MDDNETIGHVHLASVALVFIISATMSLPVEASMTVNHAAATIKPYPYKPRTSAKMRIRTIATNTLDSRT